MSTDLIGDDACREAFNKARQQRFYIHGLDVVCEPDIFRAGYAAGRDSEIAKRDARMAELEKELLACATAVENCELFRAELAAIKAPEPVGFAITDDDTGKLLPHAAFFMDRAKAEKLAALTGGCSVAALYAAPVSEAKAQGVGSPIRFWFIGDEGQKKGATLCKKSSRDGSLAFFETEEDATRAAKRHAGTAVYSVDYYKSAQLMIPERSDERGSDGELTYEAKAHNRCLDEVARLTAAPVQQVSVPDGSTKMQWPEIVALVNEVLGCEAHKYPCERGSIGHEMTGINFNSLARIIDRVRHLSAAPAAPAADAGHVFYGMDGNHP